MNSKLLSLGYCSAKSCVVMLFSIYRSNVKYCHSPLQLLLRWCSRHTGSCQYCRLSRSVAVAVVAVDDDDASLSMAKAMLDSALAK